MARSIFTPQKLQVATPETCFGGSENLPAMEREPNFNFGSFLYNLLDAYPHQRIVVISQTPCSSFSDDSRLFQIFPAQTSEEIISGGVLHKERINLDCLRDLRRIERCFVGPTIIFIDGQLELLTDPRPLLKFLRAVLHASENNKLYVRRSSEVSQQTQRVWTNERLVELFEASGFSHVESSEDWTGSVACFSSSREQYDQFLQSVRLPAANISSLLLLATGNDYALSRNIREAATHFSKNAPPDSLAILSVSPAAEFENWPENCVFLEHFWKSDSHRSLSAAERAWNAVEQMLFYYSSISRIEYQDYLGLGARLVQARQAGFIDTSTCLQARIFGTHHYLEVLEERWLKYEEVAIAEAERIALEGSDRLLFPTHRMCEIYQQAGLNISEEQIRIAEYPIAIDHQPPFFGTEKSPALTHLSRLIYLEDSQKGDGYADFLWATKQIVDSDKYQIRAVHIFGALRQDRAELTDRCNALRSKVQLISSFSSETQMQDLLQHLGKNSLITFTSDLSSPYLVSSAILCQSPFVAYSTDRLRALIPKEYHSLCLCESNPEALAKTLTRWLDLPPGERQGILTSLCESFLLQQRAKNFSLSDVDQFPIRSQHYGEAKQLEFTVLVPLWNVQERFLRELLAGLNAQILRPIEILFIDDGSDSEYAQQYEQTITHCLRLPFRLLRNDLNLGLAAARNVGLAEVRTAYVANIDADDIPLSTYLSDLAQCLSSDGEYVAATPFVQYFEDGDSFPLRSGQGEIFRPLGAGTVLGIVENCFGCANSAFQTNFLKSIGGWDQSDRSKWEDWGLFLKIVCQGRLIGVAPRIGCLVRNHRQSMRKKYRGYPAQRRLARALQEGSLSLYDSLRLQGLLRNAYLPNLGEHSLVSKTQVEAQEQMLLALSPENAQNFFSAGQEVHFQFEKQVCRVRSLGNDPQVFLSQFTYPETGRLHICACVENVSSESVKFQLYYQIHDALDYSEQRTRIAFLQPGKNIIDFRLEAAPLAGVLRIDPSDRPGELLIHTFELFHEIRSGELASHATQLASAAWCIKHGYQERKVPEYFDDIDHDRIVHQPEVYSRAMELAIKHGARRVIDIGCGKGRKLEKFIEQGIQVIGIDYGRNLEYCRRAHPEQTWLELDLEHIVPSLMLPEILEESVIIVADVIEHLKNPRPLLDTLRAWSEKAKFILLSTPERDLVHGKEHFGPPANVHHVREWNSNEFQDLLCKAGIENAELSLTRSINLADDCFTLLAVIPRNSGVMPGRNPEKSLGRGRPFVLLFVGRTGSSYLTEAMKNHPAIRMQGEVLIPERTEGGQIQVMRAALSPSSDASTSGFKTKFKDIVGKESFRALLSELECSIIHLRRRNTVKHIVSFITSRLIFEKTGKWNLYSEKDRLCPFVLDLVEFDRWREYVESESAALSQFVSELRLPILEIFYEDIQTDAQRLFQDVCRFLCVDPLPLKGHVLKNTPDDLRGILLNYEALADHLRDSEYAQFLL